MASVETLYIAAHQFARVAMVAMIARAGVVGETQASAVAVVGTYPLLAGRTCPRRRAVAASVSTYTPSVAVVGTALAASLRIRASGAGEAGVALAFSNRKTHAVVAARGIWTGSIRAIEPTIALVAFACSIRCTRSMPGTIIRARLYPTRGSPPPHLTRTAYSPAVSVSITLADMVRVVETPVENHL
eukprot:CAMPEP_0197535822 /NCGR_PEP_ID=MMETSP1318-20131121/51812_1 /TAXON_ID=552666 /ORGANISM="Partenskyella glossopodia, Strain RCC365" /LENGTH=186 /DNA_ID=CAMNT_0043093511 /DNA_START=1707 /DNA_END=2267 /DNA_ORIENTATION=-